MTLIRGDKAIQSALNVFHYPVHCEYYESVLPNIFDYKMHPIEFCASKNSTKLGCSAAVLLIKMMISFDFILYMITFSRRVSLKQIFI